MQREALSPLIWQVENSAKSFKHLVEQLPIFRLELGYRRVSLLIAERILPTPKTFCKHIPPHVKTTGHDLRFVWGNEVGIFLIHSPNTRQTILEAYFPAPQTLSELKFCSDDRPKCLINLLQRIRGSNCREISKQSGQMINDYSRISEFKRTIESVECVARPVFIGGDWSRKK